jgi:hypothetical protein
MNLANVAKRTYLIPFAVCASLLAALPVRGQDPPAQKGEIQAVARVSKQFIEDVAAREDIVANIPLSAKILIFHCQGMINGTAKLSVDMTTEKDEATFVVNGKGTASTYVRAVRGPVVAMVPAEGPFTSRTPVHFDGRKFTLGETTPWAEVHADLDRIQTRRGGLPGRAVGRLALPVGRLFLPRAEAQATPIGEAYLKDFVDDFAGGIVKKLDSTIPVEKSLNRVFPETKDWVFHMSSDSQFLQAAYGPRDAKVPVLPENPSRLKDVRLELWLHSTATEAQDLVKLSKNPLVKELIHKYLETVLPELAALSENRSLDSVGSWLVISVGAPKAK